MRNIVYAGKIKHRDKIYDGIHEPIVSEELFNIAQSLHKKRVKKYKLYRHHLFGGLIFCDECSYQMTSTFTNKHRNGDMTRYFYYRCLSTYKKDWQSCSIKQVGANRLENFIIENLERVVQDNQYLESYVFKLNYDLKEARLKLTRKKRKGGSDAPHRMGFELSNPEIEYTVEGIKSTLKKTLEAIKHGTGSDKNLNLKITIEQIRLLKDQIQITFFYRNDGWQKTTPTPHLNPSEEIRAGGQSLKTSNTAKTDDTKPLLTKNDLTPRKS